MLYGCRCQLSRQIFENTFATSPSQREELPEINAYQLRPELLFPFLQNLKITTHRGTNPPYPGVYAARTGGERHWFPSISEFVQEPMLLVRYKTPQMHAYDNSKLGAAARS